jgi:hypothetical protein
MDLGEFSLVMNSRNIYAESCLQHGKLHDSFWIWGNKP